MPRILAVVARGLETPSFNSFLIRLLIIFIPRGQPWTRASAVSRKLSEDGAGMRILQPSMRKLKRIFRNGTMCPNFQPQKRSVTRLSPYRCEAHFATASLFQPHASRHSKWRPSPQAHETVMWCCSLFRCLSVSRIFTRNLWKSRCYFQGRQTATTAFAAKLGLGFDSSES
jgi:hypothetical protein